MNTMQISSSENSDISLSDKSSEKKNSKHFLKTVKGIKWFEAVGKLSVNLSSMAELCSSL